MQDYANSNRLTIKTILFFVVVLFIAYLPVSSCMFFLKNDAFNGYFPPKFFMSESIHAGHLPLWNPYINFGIPQYGDMSSGYWSPVTWLIASTVGYNAYTLTFELLFYILLGGFGMYKLCGLWITDKQVRIIAGIAFMCSGYNVGHMQHFNWLSGVALLPFCMWSYILLLKNFSVLNSLVTAFCFYILVSSAHPGITISSVYFFAAIFLFYFFRNEKNEPFIKRMKHTGKTHFIFLSFFLLLSAGMIAGYLDILPHFVRAEKISLEDSLGNPTNIQSWISVLVPFATVKNDGLYNTDISMRNCYFSLSLLLFFLLACAKNKTGWQKFLLVTGLIFALLASGGIFKTFSYKTMPFIGYVRLNGEFRIFTLLCFILIAAIELEKFIKEKSLFTGTIKRIYFGIEIILFLLISIGLYKVFSTKESLLYTFQDVVSQTSVSLKLKALVDAVTFYDTLWIQGIIQLFFLWGIKCCIRSANLNLLKKISILNIMIACLINIPYTGVGKASVAQVQQVLNKSPKGIPIPALHPVNMNDTISIEEKGLVGDWSMYNKQVGTKEKVPYPIALNNMDAYFEANDQRQNFLNSPFIFLLPPGNKGMVAIHSFSPNNIHVSVIADTTSELVLQQNFYPHWYYQNSTGKKEVNKNGIAFMSAPVKKGENNTSFLFEPVLVEWMMLLSVICFLICLVLIFTLTVKACFSK